MGFVHTAHSAEPCLAALLNSPLCLSLELAQNSDLHSGLHPNRENSGDVDTWAIEAVPKWSFAVSCFCLCCDAALTGKPGSCRAGSLDVSRAAQPGTKNQSRYCHPEYSNAQKPSG